jgi:hypothetical protein
LYPGVGGSVHVLHAGGLAAGPLFNKLLGYEAAHGFAGMFAAGGCFIIVPDFFNILPLYMLFMMGAPFVVWSLARQTLCTLAVSLGVYGASRAGFMDAYAPALESRLYFNPFP